MCGRFDQNHTSGEYALALGWEIYGETSQAEPSYNVPPGTYRPVMHIDDGQHMIDDLHWGYQAPLAAGMMPVAINARVEKLTSRYWGQLLKFGRAIVAADGWYEWTGEKGQKQPWHIHLKTGAPMFMAALASFGPSTKNKASNGFTIVTADAEGGMVDVHDRRPVVFTAADAVRWLDPNVSPEQAEQLARSAALGPEAFEWFKVGTAVGSARNQDAELFMPIGPSAPN